RATTWPPATAACPTRRCANASRKRSSGRRSLARRVEQYPENPVAIVLDAQAISFGWRVARSDRRRDTAGPHDRVPEDDSLPVQEERIGAGTASTALDAVDYPGRHAKFPRIQFGHAFGPTRKSHDQECRSGEGHEARARGDQPAAHPCYRPLAQRDQAADAYE